jgi:hypothetical protein
MIASSGNRIYMKDDGSGFSKTYFVAIATSSQWLSGNSIKISVNKPTNTLPLTNFSQFSGLNHISYNFFGGSATRPLGFQLQTAESNFTNYVSTFIGQGLQTGLEYNESLNLNSKLDPVNPANSTYFEVLRAKVSVDDGDSQSIASLIMSPVGSSFQTFLGNVIMLPPNSLTGNVQYGKCVTELDERTTGVNLKNGRYQQTVATLYNLAIVGYVPDNNYWPNMELYGGV